MKPLDMYSEYGWDKCLKKGTWTTAVWIHHSFSPWPAVWPWASHWMSLHLYSQLFNEGIVLNLYFSLLDMCMNHPGIFYYVPHRELVQKTSGGAWRSACTWTSTSGDNEVKQSLRIPLINPCFLTSDIYQHHQKFLIFPSTYLLGFTPGNTNSRGGWDWDQDMFYRGWSWFLPQELDMALPNWELLRGAGAGRQMRCIPPTHTGNTEA